MTSVVGKFGISIKTQFYYKRSDYNLSMSLKLIIVHWKHTF